MSSAATIPAVHAGPTPARALFDVTVMTVCGAGFAAMLLGFTMLLLTNNHPGGRDFVSYWTAGHQLIHHANPYDSAAILQAERQVGFPANNQSLIMRNAPWALPLVLPLGLLSLNAGALAWSALLVLSLTLSGILLHQAFQLATPFMAKSYSGMGGSTAALPSPEPAISAPRLRFLPFAFGPALICVLCGQTAVIALLGLTLFLRFHRTRPFAAGAALWLCALKPHLFLPFAVALTLWIVTTRAVRLLAGFATVMLATSLFATALSPAIWTQYAQMMRSAGIEREFIPCLTVALRFAIHPQSMWIEYLPAAAACIWAATYYWKHRHRWSWTEHGATLMLVSVALAPYAWIMDQALLIPALMFAVYRASSTQIELFALAGAVMEFAMTFSVSAHSPFYLWTAPFWLAWFLYVLRNAKPDNPHRHALTPTS